MEGLFWILAMGDAPNQRSRATNIPDNARSISVWPINEDLSFSESRGRKKYIVSGIPRQKIIKRMLNKKICWNEPNPTGPKDRANPILRINKLATYRPLPLPMTPTFPPNPF